MKKELHNLPVVVKIYPQHNISGFLLEKFEHEPMEFVNGFINQNRSQKTDKQIALK